MTDHMTVKLTINKSRKNKNINLYDELQCRWLFCSYSSKQWYYFTCHDKYAFMSNLLFPVHGLNDDVICDSINKILRAILGHIVRLPNHVTFDLSQLSNLFIDFPVVKVGGIIRGAALPGTHFTMISSFRSHKIRFAWIFLLMICDYVKHLHVSQPLSGRGMCKYWHDIIFVHVNSKCIITRCDSWAHKRSGSGSGW